MYSTPERNSCRRFTPEPSIYPPRSRDFSNERMDKGPAVMLSSFAEQTRNMEMPGNPREMVTMAERRFPVRIRIGVPPGGFGRRHTQMTARDDRDGL
jgi:hypothetical protein